MNIYQSYIHKSRYAKPEETTWNQTVDRMVNFIGTFPERTFIDNMSVMPSMRLVATAGEAAARDNAAIYNCSYITVNDIYSFSEIMYNLMCRVGVGFSVEVPLIELLPKVPQKLKNSTCTTIRVEDDRIGWCTSYNELLLGLYAGFIPKIDYSLIRPAGSRLNTFSGLASGPLSLKKFFDFLIGIFVAAQGRKLKPIEVFDICTRCAQAIEEGGTQNTAMMCLFSSYDNEMLHAKTGNWLKEHPNRVHSNNSVVLNGAKPDMGSFNRIWELVKIGEVGFFNRTPALAREPNPWVGLNPCGEVLLQPFQFCNLSEVVCRKDDGFAEIQKKLYVATKLGAIQSRINNFRYLRSDWANHIPLLGVSITGIYDNQKMIDISSSILDSFKNYVKDVAKQFCEKEPPRCTCIKPSGTVSQLVNCSPGINPPLSEYYIRTVRQGINTEMAAKLIKAGVPYELDTNSPSKYCFFFPHHCETYQNISTEKQFEVYLKYAKYYTDHNPSMSLYVDNWDATKNLVYENLDSIIGMAFFERSRVEYQGAQLPFNPCTKEWYEECAKKMPTQIDWSDVEAEAPSECSGGFCTR